MHAEYSWPAGLEKRYTVPCLEAEILQATVDKDTFPIYLLAEAGELTRCHCCCTVPTQSVQETLAFVQYICGVVCFGNQVPALDGCQDCRTTYIPAVADGVT